MGVSTVAHRAALEEGKEVFAVPGSIFSPYLAGTARLIERRAKPVTYTSDILEGLEVEAENLRQEVRDTTPPTPEEEEVLKLLGSDELHIDEVVRCSNLDASKVSSILILMEMKGMVRHLGEGVYQAKVNN